MSEREWRAATGRTRGVAICRDLSYNPTHGSPATTCGVKRFYLFLLSPDAADGGGVSAPPPAAEKVLSSDAKEEDAAELVRLRRELDEEKAGRKKDQTRLSELEDENRRLKDVPKPKPSDPQPEKTKRSFLEGATFFG